MSAVPDLLTPTDAASRYIVSFGKGGGVGVFTAPGGVAGLRRGDRVVIGTPRGTEVGCVLCPATIRQARLLGATAAGSLLRRVEFQDENRLAEAARLGQRLFEASRTRVKQDQLALEILDVEVLLDCRQAVVQFVGDDAHLDDLAQSLEGQFDLQVRLENLALLAASQGEDEAHHRGCDRSDCGRAAGGCSTCSTGGGCSSCGASKVDMRNYFAHLREKMDKSQRVPLA
jgi:hypothetical protein